MFLLSLPMRGRGLKFRMSIWRQKAGQVAPHAGAWIEIASYRRGSISVKRRSPCGGVD